MIIKLSPLMSQNGSRSYWRLGLKLGILAAIALWWWLQEDSEEKESASYDRIELTPDIPEDAPTADDQPVVLVPDDLTEINGIGPKYAQVLQAAGVLTFVQLALLHPDDIRNIFQNAGGPVPNPDTWPEQAIQRPVI